MAVPPAIQPRRMRRRMLSKATVEGLDNRIEPEHSQCSEPMVNRFLQRPESLALCGKGADRGADAPNLNRPRFSTRSLGNARSPTIGTTNRVSGFNSLSVAMLPAAADVPLVLSLSKDEPSARGSTSSPRAVIPFCRRTTTTNPAHTVLLATMPSTASSTAINANAYCQRCWRSSCCRASTRASAPPASFSRVTAD